MASALMFALPLSAQPTSKVKGNSPRNLSNMGMVSCSRRKACTTSPVQESVISRGAVSGTQRAVRLPMLQS